MLNHRTVLVLGAGSSVDFSLPTGDALSGLIRESTAFWFDMGRQTGGDRTLYEALSSAGLKQIVPVGRRISQGLGLSRSIDDFLYNHGEDADAVLVGKAAIAHAILHAERKSPLARLASPDADERKDAALAVEGTWPYRFMRFLTTGTRRSEVQRLFENLSIINFNYDRCVETCLHRLVMNAYDLSDAEAAQVLQTLDITHPYGTVGRLNWQAGGDRTVPFGDVQAGQGLMEAATRIKTFTEQAHSDEERAYMAELIGDADRIVFLGFGFHAQNIRLIAAREQVKFLPRVYATTFGASGSDVEVFEELIRGSLLGGANLQPEMRSLRCSDFIDKTGLAIFS